MLKNVLIIHSAHSKKMFNTPWEISYCIKPSVCYALFYYRVLLNNGWSCFIHILTKPMSLTDFKLSLTIFFLKFRNHICLQLSFLFLPSLHVMHNPPPPPHPICLIGMLLQIFAVDMPRMLWVHTCLNHPETQSLLHCQDEQRKPVICAPFSAFFHSLE